MITHEKLKFMRNETEKVRLFKLHANIDAFMQTLICAKTATTAAAAAASQPANQPMHKSVHNSIDKQADC